MILILIALAQQTMGSSSAKHKRGAPTHENYSYGEHQRMKMDVWLAKSDKPTPLVIWFHGGGFKGGDKKQIRRDPIIPRCLEKGISFASCNYPYLENRDYLQCLANTKLAIAHIKKVSNEWGIDSSKIATAGVSAGALIAEFLICSDKELSAAGAFQQPKGTDLLITPLMKPGSQPVFIYQKSEKSDQVHNPRYAVYLKKHCDNNEIICELFGSNANDFPKLPKGVDPKQAMVTFFRKVWDKE
jgi:predicted esterase